ncbi:6-phosphofructokinase 1 [Bacilli bacterium PM5-3]|nr:6-phosphofructokinase 1 [Bacilli bacterium PM5-3]MDH6603508.1 6-phosphofructokinase 1 [Bacilli bacterium PM5-9]
MKKVAVLTSGGDAPGMNAAIRAVVRTCLYKNMEAYGIKEGYRGLFEDKIFKFERKSVSEKINHGGTFLGTARFDEFKNDDIVEIAANNLKKRCIDYLVVIGGDGTFNGALKLSKFGIKVACVPATIDNDIAFSQITIGFDTAVNTVIEAIDKIKDNSNSHSRCSIIEVMGRNCGDIALHSGIAVGAEEIFIDKETFTFDKVCDVVEESRKDKKRNTIIVVTENICNVIELAEYVENKTCIETRSTILGYIQRGGIPSALDRFIASGLGAHAVEMIELDNANIVVGTTGVSFYHTNIEEALNMKSNNSEDMMRLSNYLK